jgi:F420-0:gamma-glutamyl ligase
VLLTALPGFPLVQPGDDLAALIAAGMTQAALAPADGDVIVVAQKIVSKAEGRVVDLASIVPSAHAIAIAAEVDKDPRLVEVILSESRRIVRHQPNVLIVEHRLGFVMANAGVDQSNVGPHHGIERVLLLPQNRCGPHWRRVSASGSPWSSTTASGARGGAVPSVSRSVRQGFLRSSTSADPRTCSDESCKSP